MVTTLQNFFSSRIAIVVLSLLGGFSSVAQSYDYAIQNVQISLPIGVTPGSNIVNGTSLNEITFDVRNAGTNSIPTGTQLRVTLQIGTTSTPLVGTIGAAIAANATTQFVIDCSASGINANFPTTLGNFQICVESTYTPDPNSTNNRSCQSYTMVAPPARDLRIKPGSVRITNPTGISQGGSITLGATLTQFSFTIENSGTATIPSGTSLTLTTEVGSASSTPGTFTTTTAMAPGDTLGLVANTQIQGINFPTTTGAFNICATVVVANDNNAGNNKSCQAYTMVSATPQTDLRMKPGRVRITNPTGIAPGGNIQLGTTLVQIAFTVENVGAVNLPTGTSLSLTTKVGSATNTGTFTLTAPLNSGDSLALVANTQTQGVNFPTSAGQFDVCMSVVVANDNVSTNNEVCQAYTMVSGTTPSVTNMSPNSGPIGTTVTLTGSNFATSGNTVTFAGSATGTITNSTATSITVTVPTGAQTGLVTLTTNGSTVGAGIFTVTTSSAPTITNMSPSSGPIGTSVTISGTNFATSGNTVTFTGGVSGTITNSSATAITVTVPNGAQTGNVLLVTSGTPLNAGTFTVTTASAPTITNMSPTSGPIGTSVTITGTNFSTTGNIVTFIPGVQGTITNSTTSSITVTVPSGASSGPVIVNTASTQLNAGIFTISTGSTPIVTNMSPTSGPTGTTVTISGNNFGTTNTNVVFTPSVNGIITTNTSTSITVMVPTGAQTGSVTVNTAGANLSAGTFTVTTGGGGTAPTITSIAPNSGIIGDEVTITGINFNTTAINNTVTFTGGANATVKSATSTEIKVDVPTGALTGQVTVSNAGGTANSPQTFTVLTAPQIVITDFNPKRGAIGQEITIDGNLFNDTASNNTVTFTGGAVGNIVSATTQKIVVEVPAGASDGIITVNNGVNFATTPSAFTIENGPVIVKLNPASGKAGSAVTVEGFNFSTIDNENKVLFGSIDAGLPIVNAAATELEVTVPPGLSTGEHTVRLTVTGFNTVTSPKKYRVLALNSSILESSADNGLTVFSNNEGLNVSIKTLVGMKNPKITIYNVQGAKIFEQGFYAEGKTEHNHVAEVDLTSGVYILNYEDENNSMMSERFVVAQ